jgi:hypothetical protein
MLPQLSPTLELHKRVLADLERRDTAIGEREREARRLLEQAIAQCNAERTAIATERKVLMQAEQLYLRFLAASETISANQPLQELVQLETEKPDSAEAATPEPELVAAVEPPAIMAEPGPLSDIEAKMRELRSGLAEEVAREDATDQRPSKWPSPLRALRNSGS